MVTAPRRNEYRETHMQRGLRKRAETKRAGERDGTSKPRTTFLFKIWTQSTFKRPGRKPKQKQKPRGLDYQIWVGFTNTLTKGSNTGLHMSLLTSCSDYKPTPEPQASASYSTMTNKETAVRSQGEQYEGNHQEATPTSLPLWNLHKKPGSRLLPRVSMTAHFHKIAHILKKQWLCASSSGMPTASRVA